MKSRYEILMLAIPDISQEQAKLVETSLSDIVVASKGGIVSYERWGKYQLAYPVNKQEYGIYYLMRFDLPVGTDVLEKIRSLFALRFGDVILRHIVTALDINKPLVYQRPRSLEEAPPIREGLQGGQYFREGRDRRPHGNYRSDKSENRVTERDNMVTEDELSESASLHMGGE